MPHPQLLAEYRELQPRAQRWLQEWLQAELEACYRRMRLADSQEELRQEQGASRLLCRLQSDLRRSSSPDSRSLDQGSDSRESTDA